MSSAASPKLLAEWFWVDRWVLSSAFLLPLDARGLYREMLTQAWRRGARLPNDPVAIQRAVGCTAKEWKRCWPLIEKYWRVDGDDLVNDTQAEIYAETQRLHLVRAEAGRRGGKASGQARQQAKWEANNKATNQAKPNSPSPSPSPSPDQDQDHVYVATAAPKNFGDAAAPSLPGLEPSHLDGTNGSQRHATPSRPPDTSAIVLTFPTVGKGGAEWHLRADQVVRWSALYPDLDVVGEARHALAWIEADRTRRKTAGGMEKCLVSWFNRSTDRSGTSRDRPPPARAPSHRPEQGSRGPHWTALCAELHGGTCRNGYEHGLRMQDEREAG